VLDELRRLPGHGQELRPITVARANSSSTNSFRGVCPAESDVSLRTCSLSKADSTNSATRPTR
jgi:hypothetical protein